MNKIIIALILGLMAIPASAASVSPFGFSFLNEYYPEEVRDNLHYQDYRQKLLKACGFRSEYEAKYAEIQADPDDYRIEADRKFALLGLNDKYDRQYLLCKEAYKDLQAVAFPANNKERYEDVMLSDFPYEGCKARGLVYDGKGVCVNQTVTVQTTTVTNSNTQEMLMAQIAALIKIVTELQAQLAATIAAQR